MPVAPRDNGRALDQFNDQLRASPIWQDFMRRNGQNPARPKLSDQQRKMLQAELQRAGIQFPKGMEIDPAGNVNQNQSPGKKIAIGAAIGGAALTGLGAAGIGPMSGLFGGGGAAAGAGGVLPSSSLPTSALMGGAPAIASQGVSSGIPLGGLAASHIPTAALMGGAPAIASQGVSRGIGSAAGAVGGNALAKAGKGLLSNLTSMEGLSSLAPLIAALANRGGSGGGGGMEQGSMDFLQKAYDDARRTQAMAETRYRRVDPLHQAVSQLAFSRLPVNSRQGISYNNLPLPG